MSWQPKQQVNFYLPEFQPARLPHDVRLMLTEVVLMVAAILVVAMLSVSYQSYLQNELMQQQQQAAELTTAIEQERQRLQVPEPDPSLQRQLQTTRDQLRRSRQQLEYLTNTAGKLGDEGLESQSFPELMRQLGQVEAADVWLSRARILGQGQDIALDGLVRQPVALSTYLEQLTGLPAYRGRQFQQVDVRQQDRWFEFRLDTRPRQEATTGTAIMQRELNR